MFDDGMMKPTFFKSLKLSSFFNLFAIFHSFRMLPATQCHKVSRAISAMQAALNASAGDAIDAAGQISSA
ncbi:hypothetical protein [Caballeronia mineralivorans]|uniref:hypothetical protein n=1 Tax=Caballeronia mineralivorans TaxID=2010198 RepID=UPI002AFEB579|nr:hypothetical protein [Caballeronia mineralivorans]